MPVIGLIEDGRDCLSLPSGFLIWESLVSERESGQKEKARQGNCTLPLLGQKEAGRNLSRHAICGPAQKPARIWHRGKPKEIPISSPSCVLLFSSPFLLDKQEKRGAFPPRCFAYQVRTSERKRPSRQGVGKKSKSSPKAREVSLLYSEGK